MLAAAVAAAAAFLGFHVWPGSDGDAGPAFILVSRDDHCHLIPASCSSLITATNNISLAAPAKVILESDHPLRRVVAFAAPPPAETAVLVPSPPPRAA